MKKNIKKGFTLVELIVVMGIFSILMVGVMSLIGPVSNMFKSTAISEKTYAYANNVQQYLQTKLEYSESVYIGSSAKMGLTNDGVANNERLAELVENFRYKHFADTITTTDGGDTLTYLNGKIHVIRMVNSDGTLSNGDPVKKGQITHRVYDFNSKADEKIELDTVVDEVPELNAAFLDARDAAYDFSYTMGAGTLITHTPTDDSGKAIDTKERYKVVDKDLGNKLTDISSSNLTFSIVLNKKAGGFIDCKGSNAAGEYEYRAFAAPCAIQVMNLPLTNFVHRCGRVGDAGKGLQRPRLRPTAKLGIEEQTPAEAGDGCTVSSLDTNFDFTQDIYFIYCYTDEIDS